MFTVRNSAPKLSTCSRTADRVSNARTMAPIFFACAQADKPATPPPITRIFAGGTFPAATDNLEKSKQIIQFEFPSFGFHFDLVAPVICPEKNRGKWLAASMTAR